MYYHYQAGGKVSCSDANGDRANKVKRMEVYLNRFERPPLNGLVTRQLESEKSYDEAAWSDDH